LFLALLGSNLSTESPFSLFFSPANSHCRLLVPGKLETSHTLLEEGENISLVRDIEQENRRLIDRAKVLLRRDFE